MSSPLYKNIVADSIWMSEQQALNRTIPDAWHSWLFDHGSLTLQLKEFSDGDFAVNVLSQTWATPHSREAEKLRVPVDSRALIREVELVCKGEVMVFARSIIPQSLFAQDSETFENMGTKPLGHILFKGGGEQLSLRDISVYHSQSAKIIYGRSTPYRYQDGEILVSEFFVSDSLVSSN